jgi:prophage maintenance system killer protein
MKSKKFEKTKKLRLNLPAIIDALEGVKHNFSEINRQLTLKREDFNDDVMNNMIAAYQYLDDMIAKNTDMFSENGMSYIQELNHIVLCGTDLETRNEYADHIKNTNKRVKELFQPIKKWYKKHCKEHPLKIAAEVYVGVLSIPQLFIEGNHRTGALISSWILIKNGYPPLALNLKNAVHYFEPSAQIKFSKKRDVKGKLKLPKYKKHFRKFLKKFLSNEYLTEA